MFSVTLYRSTFQTILVDMRIENEVLRYLTKSSCLSRESASPTGGAVAGGAAAFCPRASEVAPRGMAAATPSIVPALINFRREIDIDVIPKFEVVEPCDGSVWVGP